MRQAAIVVAALAVGALASESAGQHYRTTGQEVVPAYEGWERNADGSFSLVFGTMNRNWEEELHIPIGPDNHIEPGGPDRGQPTYFLPRRNRFLFRVQVPSDFGDNEVVWTVKSPNGKTYRAYGTLNPDYFIDNYVVQRNNGLTTADNLQPAHEPGAGARRGERRQAHGAGGRARNPDGVRQRRRAARGAAHAAVRSVAAGQHRAQHRHGSPALLVRVPRPG